LSQSIRKSLGLHVVRSFVKNTFQRMVRWLCCMCLASTFMSVVPCL